MNQTETTHNPSKPDWQQGHLVPQGVDEQHITQAAGEICACNLELSSLEQRHHCRTQGGEHKGCTQCPYLKSSKTN